MSGVAGLFNVPTTDTEWTTWAASHAEHHREINRTLHLITGINLPDYMFDPIYTNDLGTFLLQHQDIHNAMNTYLKNPNGFDLSDLDMEDPSKYGGWFDLNAQEHRDLAVALGLD